MPSSFSVLSGRYKERSMKIVFYLGHPAQYHFIKHTVKELINDGHQIKILIKTKDILEDLLKEDGWDYENIQTVPRKNTKWSIIKASFARSWKVYRFAHSFGADMLIGTDSSIAQAAWLMRKPAITTLEDDVEVIYNLARLTFPFTSTILVPLPCRVGKWEKKKVSYYGYMKLAYLHPNRFSPDISVVDKYGITGKFIIVRLAGLTAHHDVGIKGLNVAIVHRIIDTALDHGYSVYISSESSLDPSLASYQLHIAHTDIHHILAYASMIISDSQSMSVEAAMLGTPSIRFSDFAGRISVLEELEKEYGLTFGVQPTNIVLLETKLKELLSLPDVRFEFKSRRDRMLAEKIDVTAFLIWFIENYPESKITIQNNPDFQLRFR